MVDSCDRKAKIYMLAGLDQVLESAAVASGNVCGALDQMACNKGTS